MTERREHHQRTRRDDNMLYRLIKETAPVIAAITIIGGGLFWVVGTKFATITEVQASEKRLDDKTNKMKSEYTAKVTKIDKTLAVQTEKLHSITKEQERAAEERKEILFILRRGYNGYSRGAR